VYLLYIEEKFIIYPAYYFHAQIEIHDRVTDKLMNLLYAENLKEKRNGAPQVHGTT
jgi:hypothetical protein